MDQARILIFSEDPEFVNSVVQSWQGLEYRPEFAVAGAGNGDAKVVADRAANSVADGVAKCIANCVALADGAAALQHLPADVALVIVVVDELLPEAGQNGTRRMVQIRRGASWADHAALLAQETLLRLEAQAHRVEAVRKLRESEHFAALGRFIVEARHELGNALTSVLGHSELLLLEPGLETIDGVQAQLKTIHAMSLRMHETLHRLSSLEMEMKMAERNAVAQSLGSQARAAGQQ